MHDVTPARLVALYDGSEKRMAMPLWHYLKRSHGGCWEYVRARNGKGYGSIWFRGKVTEAHRVAWTLALGRIPAGMFVCHACDNPPCCNPDHLFLGTALDNNRDRHQKGRDGRPSGEGNGRAKLTRPQVEEIRAAYVGGESQVSLARRFPVSRTVVGMICRGQIWAA